MSFTSQTSSRNGDQLKGTMNDARDTAINVKDDLREGAEEFRDRAYQAGKRVSSFLSNARDDLSDLTDTATTQIKNHPMQSSLAALCVGVVLGMLIRR